MVGFSVDNQPVKRAQQVAGPQRVRPRRNGAFSTTGPHDDTSAASQVATANFDQNPLRADLTLSGIVGISCCTMNGWVSCPSRQ